MHFLTNNYFNEMNYLQFRQKYSLLIYYGQYFIIMLSLFLMLIWKSIIYYVIGFIFLLNILEFNFLKCDNCGKRPMSFWCQFPEKCKHCGKKLEK